MLAAVQSYVDAFAREDADAIASLYAADATVEDPVGSPPLHGLDAIRGFYGHSVSLKAKLTLEGPVRTAGNVAAFAFSVRIEHGSAPMRIDVIDTFHFNDQGKIVAMRAYWGSDNVGPA
jgi:steroid delta-isomerase